MKFKSTVDIFNKKNMFSKFVNDNKILQLGNRISTDNTKQMS